MCSVSSVTHVAHGTWRCRIKLSDTTRYINTSYMYNRLNPMKLQILLEDQTGTEILFLSYVATTTINCMTWLACISRRHVHKRGQNCNGTDMKIKKGTKLGKEGRRRVSVPSFFLFPAPPPFYASPPLFRVSPLSRAWNGLLTCWLLFPACKRP